jgi:hypothetical protein
LPGCSLHTGAGNNNRLLPDPFFYPRESDQTAAARAYLLRITGSSQPASQPVPSGVSARLQRGMVHVFSFQKKKSACIRSDACPVSSCYSGALFTYQTVLRVTAPVILEILLFYDIYPLFYYGSGTDFSGRFIEELGRIWEKTVKSNQSAYIAYFRIIFIATTIEQNIFFHSIPDRLYPGRYHFHVFYSVC